jgi:hypothetical protein
MARLIYQANFCAECGNRLTHHRWWQPGYFCPHCAGQRGRRRYFRPVALLVCGISLGLIINATRRESTPDHLAPLAALTAVSAQDATARLRPAPPGSAAAAATEYFFCGARTKKGTPCKHRVRQQGQRCAQHQGRASLLKDSQSSASR